ARTRAPVQALCQRTKSFLERADAAEADPQILRHQRGRRKNAGKRDRPSRPLRPRPRPHPESRAHDCGLGRLGEFRDAPSRRGHPIPHPRPHLLGVGAPEKSSTRRIQESAARTAKPPSILVVSVAFLGVLRVKAFDWGAPKVRALQGKRRGRAYPYRPNARQYFTGGAVPRPLLGTKHRLTYRSTIYIIEVGRAASDTLGRF